MKVAVSDDVLLKSGAVVKITKEYAPGRFIGETSDPKKGWVAVNFGLEDIERVTWASSYEE